MIEEFVQMLTEKNDFTNVENQYSNSFIYSEITVNNLTRYLVNIKRLSPRYMLVGEAPGYNGCRWSGIPFTAEKNLTKEYVPNSLFGLDNGFQVRDPNEPQSEQSATIVWNYLHQKKLYPLMWNAFPFHPHQPGNTNTNRKPNGSELEYGRFVIEYLKRIFDIEAIIAVGNTAYQTLTKMSFICQKIRHPANGGKQGFIDGFNAISENSQLE